MTVTYTGKVANARLCGFSRLLLYWRASIYKLMYKEILIFITLYTLISIVYRFFLAEWEKRWFEKVALYCEAFTNLIPLSFILGFYVAIVVTRWWNQYLSIPWPDTIMMYVATIIEGIDEKGRLFRRTVMRYLMLGSLLVFQGTSPAIKKRFPTVDHLVEAGILTEHEKNCLDDIQTPHGKWWVPFVWCCNLVKEARQEGRIADDFLFRTILEAIQQYRANVGMLYSFDWISIPLVYTQVTTLAVYTFFLGCIFGRQFLDPSQAYQGHEVDIFIPVFTILQFFFYMGWLKVAEQMINPFGEDDDDFDMHWIIDRNMQLSFLTVDDMYGTYPKMEQDVYFNEMPPPYLPYTEKTVNSMTKPFMGSSADLSLSGDDMKVVNPMETIQEGYTLDIPHDISVAASPMSSPTHSRRIMQSSSHLSTLAGVRSNLGVSKSTLDGLKPQERCDTKPLFQTMNGSMVAKAPSYIDFWFHQRGESRPATPCAETSSRPRSLHVGGSPYVGRRDHVVDMQGHFQSNTPTPIDTPPATNAADEVFQPANLAEAATGNTQINDTPLIKVTTESQRELEEKLTNLLERGLSSSSDSESLQDYEPPESNQSTVNSITPLLKAQEQEEILDKLDDATENKACIV